MSTRKFWVRSLRMAAWALLGAVVCLAAYVPIQQRVLRWRAERLLNDIRDLQVGSDWAHADAFMNRWKRWGTFPAGCASDHCQDWIQIQDGLWTLRSICGERCRFLNMLDSPYRWFGGRTAMVEGQLGVESGTVVLTKFLVFVEVPAGRSQEYPEQHGLFGTATEVEGFDPYNFRGQRLLHPEYWIGNPGGCEGCVKAMTSFTPLAGRNKIRQLTNFDFSCITRWHACADQSELMPSAWEEYISELGENEHRDRAFEQCDVPLEFLGREYQDIAVADVLSASYQPEPTLGGGSWEEARIRVVQILKGKTDWPLLSPETAIALDRGQGVPGWRIDNLKSGERYIFLGTFGTNPAHHKELALGDCGLIPLTADNLAAIQRGIDAAKSRALALSQKKPSL